MKELITAKDAAKIAETFIDSTCETQLEKVSEEIEKAAKKGNKMTTVYLDLRPQVIQRLSDLGYGIVLKMDNDPREGGSYYVISW